MTDEEFARFETVAIDTLNLLFNEFERLSIQNGAYQTALSHVSDATERKTLEERFRQECQTLREIPKYSDLRRLAIAAVRDRNPDEFDLLMPQLKARFVVWDGGRSWTK